jgi:hypothetical protein
MEGERYTVLLPSAPQIAGAGVTGLGEHRLASLVVHGDGVELRIDRPVVVTVSRSETLVRVGER